MKRIIVYSTQLMATGGIESHMLEFCKHMSEKGVLIDLVVLNTAVLPETEQYYKEVCNKIFFAKKGRSFIRVLWLFVLGLKLKLKAYDAFYSNGQGKSIKVFKSLLTIKGPWVHHHHTSGDKEDQRTWEKSYLKILKTSDKVIACSGGIARNMAAVLNRDVDSIPCFSRKITSQKVEIIKNKKVKFGYYGRLIPEKGIDTLCKLSEESDLDNLEFHIWGEGKAYPLGFFDAYPKLHYHGAFSGLAGLTEAISTIDAFVLLTVHSEGLPICLLESMGAGLPWIATDRGGIPDIACDPMSTRVIPADSDFDQVKQALKLFAEDILQGKTPTDAEKRLYAEKFSASALVHKWSEVLKLS